MISFELVVDVINSILIMIVILFVVLKLFGGEGK